MPINSAGFIPELEDERKNRISKYFKDAFGEDVAVDKVGSAIRSLYLILLQIDRLFDASFGYAFSQVKLDTAEGDNLDALGLLANTRRLLSKRSTTTLEFSGLPGTVIAQGFRVSEPTTGINFITLSEVRIDTNFKAMVIAESVESGKKTNFDIGVITNIVNPNPNIENVQNITAAIGGGDTEPDDEYRARITSLFTENIGNASNLIKAFSRIDGVSSVNFQENLKAETVGGLPPLSVNFLITGGTDSQIANVFYEFGALPFRTFGSHRVAVANPSGRIMEYFFDRPESFKINIKLTLSKFDINKSFSTRFKEDLVVQVENYINNNKISRRRIGGLEIISGIQEVSVKRFQEDWSNLRNIEVKINDADFVDLAFSQIATVNSVEIIDS